MEKNRLAETLKKYQMLVEYNFYVPKGMDEQEAPPAAEPAPEGDIPPAAGAGPEAPPAAEMGAPATPEAAPDAPPMGADMPEPAPNAEGEVELDITDLVNSTKDTKDKIEGTNELLNNLMGKFDELEGKISSFDQIINRIDNLEKDLDKRLPTPVEKLEMRSMDSYPYSLKLTDFWKEEGDDVETLEQKEEEHTLTPEDIKKDYSPSDIKTSFDVQSPEDQNF